MIDVLVVDQSRLIGSITATVLKDESDMRVIGSTASLDEALTILRSWPCDVVLVSTNLPGGAALELIRALPSDSSPRVVVIGVVEDEEAILRYVEAGAAGYVLRDDSEEDLVNKIRAVHAGEALVSPEMAAALMTRISELADMRPPLEAEMDRFSELTPREQEVLDLIGEDLSNQEIAERLVIEVGTVKNHVHNILRKLDVCSRRDAALYWDVIQDITD